MSSTLSEGVRVPDIGSTSWGADVNYNWGLLNTALANISGNVKTDAENTWTAPQTFTETISGSIDGVATRAVGDEDGNNIKTALAGKAADNAVVHLAGAETITGDKTWTGSNAFNSILPNATNAYSLGSSSYQWSAVYAQNYYYKGTQWGLDKANVWTADQTIASNRFLTVYGYRFLIKSSNMELGTVPSSNQWTGFSFTDKNDSAISEIVLSFQRNGNLLYQINVCPNEADSVKRSVLAYTYNSAANANSLAFTSRVLPTDSGTYDLGTSSNKWKTLNGINPGALSFPNLDYSNSNRWIDISGNITQLTGGDNWYYPTVDGWVFVITKNNPVFLNVIVFATTGKMMTGASGVVEPSSGAMWVSCPAPAGSRVRIRANNGSTGAIESAQFILCLGNV